MRKLFQWAIIISIVLLSGIAWMGVATAAPEGQKKWDEVVAAAKKEGSLVIYGNMVPQQVKEIQKGFSSRFGIKLDIMSGKSDEVAARWERERDAGLNLVDIFTLGGVTAVLTLKP